MTGYVERIQTDGLRGYVQGDDGGKYLFDHRAVGGGLEFAILLVGQRVDFVSAHYGNNLVAVDIRPEEVDEWQS